MFMKIQWLDDYIESKIKELKIDEKGDDRWLITKGKLLSMI